MNGFATRARLETMSERIARERKERTDAFRHIVLLGIVFATLLVTGLLNGCATDPSIDGREQTTFARRGK